VGRSGRRDETALQVTGHWHDLSRAVETSGQTLDLRLTEQRKEQAAKRFLTQAIRRHGVPEKITGDGSQANAAAISSDHAAHGTAMIIRQVHYLQKSIEPAHRRVKRVTRPMLGFTSCDAAQGTLAGIELMHMLKKSQRVGADGAAGLTPAEQFYALAA
jgi:putative transposase